MVFKALSKAVKKHIEAGKQETRMKQAVAAVELERKKAASATGRLTVKEIAQNFGVALSTLYTRLKGTVSVLEFNSSKQKLSKPEEDTIVDLICNSADRGLPLSHTDVASYANAILESRGGPEFEPVGKSWVDRFLVRHRDRVQTHWSKHLDTQRARSLNPAAVQDWFDLVEEHVEKAGIRKEDIYGMDESGFPPSNQGTERVIGRRGTKTQHKQGGGDRENVTAVITICADGSALRPLIIYKGTYFMARWNENNVSDAR